MDFLTIMNQVLIIFLIVIVGYVAAKLGYITQPVRRGLIELLINIAIPAMIIVSFDTELPASALGNVTVVFIIAMISHFLMAVLGGFVFRNRPERARSVLIFATVFSNCAFVGYPIIESLYGEIGVIYNSIYNLVFNLYLWTFGQVLFTGARDLKSMRKALVNSGTFAVLTGLILLLTPLKLPFIVTRVASLVGSVTTPMAMIVIGAMLAEVRMRDMLRGRAIYVATILRLLVIPVAAFAILHLLRVDPVIAAVSAILVGLPAGSNAVIFAEKFNGDSILATRIVVMTTALSILSIPLLAILVS